MSKTASDQAREWIDSARRIVVLTQKPRLWQGVMQHRELHWERIADAPAN